MWVVIILFFLYIIGTTQNTKVETQQNNATENSNNNVQSLNTTINIDKETNEINQNNIAETITNIINTQNGKYDGDIVDGKMQGNGTYEWNDGSKYVGEFSNSQINGKGTLTIPNKGSYEGIFSNGKKNGKWHNRKFQPNRLFFQILEAIIQSFKSFSCQIIQFERLNSIDVLNNPGNHTIYTISLLCTIFF